MLKPYRATGVATALSAVLLVPPAWADINFSGFATFMVATQSDEDTQFRTLDTGLSFDDGTLFGLQVETEINEQMSLTGQFISRGYEQYEVRNEWAYFTYQATPELAIQGGKQRLPFFFYSAFSDVGYAYHWTRPPGEIYHLPINTFNGVNASWRTSYDDIGILLQAYGGEVDETGVRVLNSVLGQQDYLFNFADSIYGLVGSLSWKNYLVRVSAHQAEVTATNNTINDALAGFLAVGVPASVVDALDINDDQVSFYELALGADFDTFFLQSEITFLDYPDSLQPDETAWMFSGGYRMGEYTLHLTYAALERDLAEIYRDAPAPFQPAVEGLQRLFDSSYTSFIAGVRWDFLPGTALKAEVQDFTFTQETDVSLPGLVRPADDYNILVYTVSVDVVF